MMTCSMGLARLPSSAGSSLIQCAWLSRRMHQNQFMDVLVNMCFGMDLLVMDAFYS